jgi:phosphoribosylaminoimidazole (AIR) synthetase
MILVIPPRKVDIALRSLKRNGEKPWVIGELIQQRRARPRVEYV